MPTSTWYEFNNLTAAQVYDILQLRELVFTIGQQCSEPDMDDIDRTALHHVMYAGDQLIAYLRVYHQADTYHIGRVVVHPDQQGKGLGREIMINTINYLRERFPGKPIEMSAQYHLEKFYQSLGFETVGDVYQEAGIEHVGMCLSSKNIKNNINKNQ